MKILYVRVLLEKNERMSTPIWVYPWELPVLAAAHRDNGVQVLDRKVFEKRVAPRADVEFERLANRYKAPEGSDIPFVVQVYGHGAMGLRKLQDEMVEAAKQTEAVAASPDPAPEVQGSTVEEYASPFGTPPELPPDPSDQASLRAFAEGGAESDPTPVAINA